MSSTDFTPELTTSTPVAARTPMSADTSQLTGSSPAGRCTPPRPPVANTPIPAACANAAVPATVVAPVRPRPIAGPRSRNDSLATSSLVHSVWIWAGVSPTVGLPSRTAIVAGTAPSSRTVRSSWAAMERLWRGGKPGASSVDSYATTARPAEIASATSFDISMRTHASWPTARKCRCATRPWGPGPAAWDHPCRQPGATRPTAAPMHRPATARARDRRTGTGRCRPSPEVRQNGLVATTQVLPDVDTRPEGTDATDDDSPEVFHYV